MAWMYPKHSCGHAGERYQAYGKEDGRQRELASKERQACPDCRKSEADAKAAEAGLPQLIGSPKQVAWASEIRERTLRLLPLEKTEKFRPETSAKWCIDHRGVCNA